MLDSDAVLQYLQAVPKAELHVHMEGSIHPATLLTLAQRNSVRLPASNLEEMYDWFRFRDFAHFIEIYGLLSKSLKVAADYELITYEFGAEMARRDFGVEIRWVFDIVRDIKDEQDRRRRAEYTTAVALECRNDGVIALGLGGFEADYPPEQFASWFDRARAGGLHSAPHAGEGAGPASIWGALRALGAERIGHGVRAIEDPELLAYLATHNILLEVNPLSNICLGFYSSMAEHPLAALYAAGIPITVNSDDPPLFNATLTQNIEVLHTACDFSLDVIDEILLNGVRYSFLPSSEKEPLVATMQREMVQLRQVYKLPSVQGIDVSRETMP